MRFKEMEPRTSGVYLQPEYTDKFSANDLDFLGIGPPSPKIYSRRIPPQKPQQLSSPEASKLSIIIIPSVSYGNMTPMGRLIYSCVIEESTKSWQMIFHICSLFQWI